MNVVCVGSHPDDVEMGMGGTILKHTKNGDNVTIVLCTLGGASGHHRERKKEAKKAAMILGVKDLQILNYPVSKLNKPSKEFVNILRKIIVKTKAQRVYTHSPCDFHQVDVSVSKSSIKASEKIKHVFFYETISSTTPDFKPNSYVDITKFISKKLQSLRSHKTQADRFYLSPNVIKSLANTRYVCGKVGSNSKGFAEAFTAYRYTI